MAGYHLPRWRSEERPTTVRAVFGLSFGEVVLLALIAMIVVGPRNLPTMLRTLGRTIGKLKRMTVEIREQTGIDEILRGEGIEKEMEQLRMIASGRILDVDLADDPADEHPPRYREYPRMGVDAYDAIPEDTAPYVPVEQSNAAPAAEAKTETPETPKDDSPTEEAATDEAVAGNERRNERKNETTNEAKGVAAVGAVGEDAGREVQTSTVKDAPAGLSRGSRRSSASLTNDSFDNPHSVADASTAAVATVPVSDQADAIADKGAGE
jgi:sec-independent protein translocase protein TatB